VIAALKGNDVLPPGEGTSTSGQANPGTNEPPVLNPKPGALPA
jgi:hypothetical protein